ncbi:MAG TPA: transglutaminase-like domain-containing protein, partial [Thermoanaerobaculia bacterium]|nr:transglutaminase-like domain-containing protein [Thermoanaerobaculia bacterium]
GARTVLEAVERVVSFTSRVLKYEAPTGEAETAVSCRRRGRGSCVGRSLVAEDLLLRSGVPARQVTGVLAAAAATELTSETRALFNEALGGVRHRWIEAYVPGLGWVPSDPGGLANAVTSRYLALRGAPGPDFGVETVARSEEVRWPALAMPGPGLTLARARWGTR